MKKFKRKYRYTCILIILYLVNATYSFAQIDSLEQLLPTLPENTQKVDVLNELSYLYHENDIQQTFAYANEAFDLSDDLNYLKGKAAAFHNLGVANSISGNLQEAMKFNDKAMHLADSIKAYRILIDTYQSKGFIQSIASNPEIAIQFYQKSNDLAEQENYPKGIILTCVSLGDSYANLEEYDKARAYYNRAISIGKSIKDKNNIAWGIRAIALTYYDEQDYKKADLFFKKALKIAREVNDKRLLSYALGESARNYLKLGKKELAEQYMLESIQFIQAVGDNEGEVMRLLDLAELYLETKQPNKVIEISNQALALNKKNSSSILQIDLLDILYDAYVQKQAFKTAYEIELLARVKRDSLDYTNKLNLTAELEEKYQSKKKETENALLRAEQTYQNRIKTFLIGTLGFSVLFLILLGYTIRQVRLKNNSLNESLAVQKINGIQAQKLKDAEEQKNQLFINIAHELQTPLNIIQGLSQQILGSEKLTNKTLKAQEMIWKNSVVLSKLSNTILSAHNIESTLTSVSKDFELFSLEDLIQHILSEHQFLIEQKEITINVIDFKNKPIPIYSDVYKVETCLKNLVANAIKYTQKGGVIFIDYSTEKSGYHQITIRDNGRGIDKEKLLTIFDRYYQVNNEEPEGGVGLGLAICKDYATSLGGEIYVESQLGAGSSFYVSLPLTPERKLKEKETFYQFPAIENEVPLNEPKNKTTPNDFLLIVEDNLDFCKYLKSILEEEYNLIFAHDGEQAIACLEKEKRVPSLIITDFMMPAMNGIALIKYLKASDRYQNIPTILLTARNLVSDRDNALRIGVDDYLTKPIDNEVLKNRINLLLNSREDRDEFNKAFSPVSPKEEADLISTKNQDWLIEVEQIIFSKVSEFDLNLEEISSLLNISIKHFNRKIKRLTGFTAKRYIQEVRYWEARRLIEERVYGSVKAVCYSVGFKNVKYFSRKFKERFGKNPRDFFEH